MRDSCRGAFASISSQTFEDWELVVVDDGSTDDTRDVVADLARRLRQPVRFEAQSNQGAYGARNTGLDFATGAYVAFFDSDDQWLPHHLARCVAALDRVASVDWVYAACRSVDEATGTVLHPTTFAVDGQPRPFLKLHTRRDGDLLVFDDPDVLACQIEHGLYAGLQNSVIRREVFAGRRFWGDYRVVEDVQFLIRSLVGGARLGYYPDVHVVYRVHDDNSSASASGGTADRLIPIFEEQVRGFERLRVEYDLPGAAGRLLRAQLAHMVLLAARLRGLLARGTSRRGDGGIQVSPGAAAGGSRHVEDVCLLPDSDVMAAMRVLLATNSCDRGSTSRTLEGWTTHLPWHGIEPVVSVGGRGPLLDALLSAGVRVAVRPIRVFPSKIWPAPFAIAVWRYVRLIWRVKPDLVHVNEHEHYPVVAYAARLTSTPVVVHLRFRPTPRALRVALQASLPADPPLFHSETQMREVAPNVRGLVPEDRWRLLPNAVDLTAFLPDAEARAGFALSGESTTPSARLEPPRRFRRGSAWITSCACSCRRRSRSSGSGVHRRNAIFSRRP